MQHAKPQVMLEGFEVAVVVQQLVAFLNAEGGNDAVDGLAYCNSEALQKSEVLR
jgi:hypothetical protein